MQSCSGEWWAKRPGVYEIVIGDTRYLGSTIEKRGLWFRFLTNRSHLRNGKHHNPTLQRAFDAWGESTMMFNPLVVSDQPRELEASLIACVPNCNISATTTYPDSTGRVLSIETREKISMAKMGKPGHPQSDEARRRIAAAKMGNQHARKVRP